MLALRYQDHFLDLGKATATIKITSPLFDPDRAARVYSFPFRIPMTVGNQAKLQHVQRIDSRATPSSVPGAFYYKDELYDQGLIKLKKKRKDFVQLYFQNIQIEFLEKLEQIKINKILDQVSFETFPAGGAPRWEFEVIVGGSTSYDITIRDTTFHHEATGGESAIDIANALAIQINAVFPQLSPTGPFDSALIINSYEDDAALIDFESVSDNLDLTYEYTFAQAQQTRFLGYLNLLSGVAVEKICFPTLQNGKFYRNRDGNPDFGDLINPYQNGSYLLPAGNKRFSWTGTFTPFPFVKYVLEKLVTEAGYLGIRGDITALQEYAELVIYNNVALDKVMFEHTSSGNLYFNYFQKEININDHVPEMTGKEFLKSLLEFLGLFYEVRGDYVYLQSITAPVRQPPVDWTKKASTKAEVNVVEKKGVTLSFSNDPEDQYSNPAQQQDYIIGAGGTPLETSWGTLHTVSRSIAPDIGLAIIPTTLQVGQSEEVSQADGSYTPRLLLFKGFRQGSLGPSYPMATTDTVDYLGNSIGDIALRWEGPDGLYEQLHRGRVNLLDKDTVSIQVDLSSADIQELKRWRNSRRRIEHPEGVIDGVVTSVSQRASATALSMATVEIRLLI